MVRGYQWVTIPCLKDYPRNPTKYGSKGTPKTQFPISLMNWEKLARKT